MSTKTWEAWYSEIEVCMDTFKVDLNAACMAAESRILKYGGLGFFNGYKFPKEWLEVRD